MLHKEQFRRYLLQGTLCVMMKSEKCMKDFLNWLTLKKKEGEDTFERKKMLLEECNLDLNIFRSEGYENTSKSRENLRGQNKNSPRKSKRILHSMYCSHTLNLCGIHATETNLDVKTYFGNV